MKFSAIKVSWKVKPEWKDGQLYELYFQLRIHELLAEGNRNNCSGYLTRQSGSDDGIKVFLT